METTRSEVEVSKHAEGTGKPAASAAPAPTPMPKVAVLLCTYNGAEFLEEQLESIWRQEASRVEVYASDDQSWDDTRAILEKFKDRPDGFLKLYEGPGRGHVANFFSLICAPIQADYYAYADQDDVWDADKLVRATEALAAVPDGRPAIYCSRTRLMSKGGSQIGLSPLFRKPPEFSNALIHNIGGGNTMVLNYSAMQLLRAVGQVDVVSHDWWTYILVTGAGGEVIYDAEPSLSYRQHPKNLIGSNMSWRDRFQRFSLALQGRNRAWNTRNTQALQQARSWLTPENRKVLDEFCRARNARLVPRMLGMKRAGVYAQSGWGSLSLVAATFLKKL